MFGVCVHALVGHENTSGGLIVFFRYVALLKINNNFTTN